MILRRLLTVRRWTGLLLAFLVSLQVAVAPLSDATAHGGPAPDPFSVICSHDDAAAGPADQKDRRPAGKGSCCEAGCLMAAVGFAVPAQDFDRVAHALAITRGRPGFAPDALSPPARPQDGAPQAPRGPPLPIG
jgi:hypothetical protein